MKPSIVVICGAPLSGKTSVAGIVARQLGLHWIDIDELAAVAFGSYSVEGQDEQVDAERRERTAMAYRLMHQAIDMHFETKLAMSPLLITAPYSRNSSWHFMLRVLNRHSVEPKVIWLRSTDPYCESIKDRVSTRVTGGDFLGDTYCPVDVDQYHEVLRYFEPPPLFHMTVSTWPKNSILESAKRVVQLLTENDKLPESNHMNVHRASLPNC